MKLIIPILCLLLISCSKQTTKEHTKLESSKPSTKIVKKEIKASSPALIFISDYVWRSNYNNSHLKTTLFQNDKEVLNQIKDTLKRYKVNRYSFLPTPHSFQFTIYDDKSFVIQNYYVDTSFKKGKVLLIPTHFQHRHELPISSWEALKTNFNNASKEDFFLLDLKEARQVSSIAKEKKLLILNQQSENRMWPYFDGEFAFSSIKIGNREEDSEIHNNIFSSFPQDSFQIISSNYKTWVRQVESIGESHHETIIKISSDSSFYDKFNIYSPKTFFKKYVANFVLIGTKNELETVKAILKK